MPCNQPPITCPQSHGQYYPHQYKLDLFHQGACVFKVTKTKDHFWSFTCLIKDGGFPYNVTFQHEVETGVVGTWTTKILVLLPYICFSGLLSRAVSSQAKNDGAVLSQDPGAKCKGEFFPVPRDVWQSCKQLQPAPSGSAVLSIPSFLAME